MKKLILIFALCCCGRGFAAIQLQQTCMANASGTSVACASTSNFTSGYIVVEWEMAGNSDQTTPTMSGAGCPASFTTIAAVANQQIMRIGTAGTGACTITSHVTGAAEGLAMEWWLISGATTTVDCSGTTTVDTGAQTENGATCTTAVSGDLVIGVAMELSGAGDASFAVQTPFSVAAPGQTTTSLSPQGYPQMAASIVQSTAGAIQLKWTQGISAFNFSAIVAVEPSAGGGGATCNPTMSTLGVSSCG